MIVSDDYLREIPKPPSVRVIEYEVSADDRWAITWVTDWGLVCSYKPNLWSCYPLPVDE